MKKVKKYVIMLLTVAMIIGSFNVVLAWYDEADLPVTPSCTAYCDVWCNRYSSTASTHLYIDKSYDYVNAYVSLTVTGGRELGYEVLGTDSHSESSVYDSRALADAEVNHADVPYKAESYHEASVNISSNDTELTAMFD
ncbi:MAG: hypothetical protein E7261_06100 [Lachnospiraceae bacterium]|nr:hypothetical protein [Lachnospiraceae bacterium]